MLGYFFNPQELQLNQIKHKHLPPQILYTTLTYENRIKTGRFLIKFETVLPSQKNKCHAFSLISKMINSLFVVMIKKI